LYEVIFKIKLEQISQIDANSSKTQKSGNLFEV